jgi:hypothetical protein
MVDHGSVAVEEVARNAVVVADVNMDDRRTGLVGLVRRAGDLERRDRQVRRRLSPVLAAGDGDRDDQRIDENSSTSSNGNNGLGRRA